MQLNISRTGKIAIAVLVLITAALAPAGAARTTPSAAFSLSVDPSSVSPAGTVTVSGSVTNTSSSTEKLTINYVVSGPNGCSYSESYSVNVTLHPGEAQSASVSRTVPSCPGTYTITGTVQAGGTVLATASTTFTVQSTG
jgi:hypothetical protein